MLPKGLLFNPTEFSDDDLTLYFGGTVVRVHFPLKTKQKPKWLTWGKPSKNQILFSSREGTLLSIPKEDILIEQVFPVGLFNSKTTVLLGERTGTRQVTKGICKANYSLIPLEKIMSELGFFKVGLGKLHYSLVTVNALSHISYSPEVLEPIFEEQKYFSLKESVTAIRSRKAFARALSNEFALVPHPYLQGSFLVFRNDLPVAELVSKNKIKILIEELRQECTDFFQELGAKVV